MRGFFSDEPHVHTLGRVLHHMHGRYCSGLRTSFGGLMILMVQKSFAQNMGAYSKYLKFIYCNQREPLHSSPAHCVKSTPTPPRVISCTISQHIP